MENGLVSPVDEGTPQGPLSPLLSNIVLELDRELERRGHRFVRYADDSNIYVRSQRAGERVMEHITRFLTTKLKLKVKDEECGGSTEEPKVSRVQLYGRRETATAHCVKSDLAVQGADPRTNEPNTRNQHGAESESTLSGEAILASARRPRSCGLLISGCGADCGRRSGSSGSSGVRSSRNFEPGALGAILQPKRLPVLTARGDWERARP
jgi:hypothetical protein